MTSIVDRDDFPTWGNSHAADFEADTWTFKMCNERYEVSKGPYALIHNDDYDAMMHEIHDANTRLLRAQALLQRIAEANWSEGIGGQLHDDIVAFFDPAPLG